MISIRKTWWAGLALAALAGCGGEEQDAPSLPATPSPVGGVNPDPTARLRQQGMLPKDEAPKTEAPKTEEPKVEAPKTEEPKIEAPKVEPPKDEEKPKAASAALTDDEIAEIKKLPAAEQALALKQLVCPVSGEHLGSMEMPLKVTAEGKTFFLCCKGCEKDLKADPKAVVARLK
jgi:hypothetical protein